MDNTASIAAAVDRGKREILADLASGLLPKSFVTAPLATKPYADNASRESGLITMPTMQAGAPSTGPGNRGRSGDTADQYIVPAGPDGIRRLTPLECERLQGFPDNYTLVPYRDRPAADNPRYKALGNSMAVPVIRWIGERIQLVDAI